VAEDAFGRAPSIGVVSFGKTRIRDQYRAVCISSCHLDIVSKPCLVSYLIAAQDMQDQAVKFRHGRGALFIYPTQSIPHLEPSRLPRLTSRQSFDLEHVAG
jgi:hypothetical protein